MYIYTIHAIKSLISLCKLSIFEWGCCAFLDSLFGACLHLLSVFETTPPKNLGSSLYHQVIRSSSGWIDPSDVPTLSTPPSVSFAASSHFFIFLFAPVIIFSFELVFAFRFLLVPLFALSWFLYPSSQEGEKVHCRFY